MPTKRQGPSDQTVSRPWRGVSADDRMTQRRERLLDAGRDVIADAGSAGVNVGDICTRAKLNKRYFYESFENADAFVDAVVQDAVTELFEHMERAAGERKPADDAMLAITDAVLDAFERDPRLVRVLLVESFGAGGALTGVRNQLLGLATHRAMLLAGLDPSAYEPAELEVMSFATTGALAEVIVAWFDGGLKISRKRLAADLVSIGRRLLGGDRS